MANITHLTIRITGRVQGVNFRRTAQQVAWRLSLVGYARNHPDGSVVIEVEGQPKQLEQFVEWCRQGPNTAEVQNLQVHEGSLKHFEDFTVR